MQSPESLRVECAVHSFVFEKNDKRQKVSFALVKPGGYSFYVLTESGMRQLSQGTRSLGTGRFAFKKLVSDCACGDFSIAGPPGSSRSQILVVDSILSGKSQADRFCQSFLGSDWAGKRASAFLSVAFHVAKTMGMQRLELADMAVIERDQPTGYFSREVKFSAKSTLLGGPAFYERWGFKYDNEDGPAREELRQELRKQYLLAEGEAAVALDQIRASEEAWLWGKLSKARLAELRARVEQLELKKADLCHAWYEDGKWTANLAISGKEYEDWKQECENKGAWMPTTYSPGEVEAFEATDSQKFRDVSRRMQPTLKRGREEEQAAVGHSHGTPSLHLLRL